MRDQHGRDPGIGKKAESGFPDVSPIHGIAVSLYQCLEPGIPRVTIPEYFKGKNRGGEIHDLREIVFSRRLEKDRIHDLHFLAPFYQSRYGIEVNRTEKLNTGPLRMACS